MNTISGNYVNSILTAINNRKTSSLVKSSNSQATQTQVQAPSAHASSLNLIFSFGLKNGQDLFSGYLRNFALDSSGNIKDIKDYDIRGTIDEMAKSYVYLQQKIENDDSLSSQQKQEYLTTLEEQFDSGLDEFVKLYDVSTKSQLNSLGLSNFGDIKEDIKDLVKEQATAFKDFLETDEFKAQASISKFTNESDFDAFSLVIDKSQEKYLAAVKDGTISQEDNVFAQGKKDRKFSLNNLASLHQSAKAMDRFDLPDLNASEEEIGFIFAVKSMAVFDSLKQEGASEDFYNQMSKGLENKIDEFVKEQNKALQSKSEQAEETQKGSGVKYGSLDLSAIKSVYNSGISFYGTGEDTVQSMLSAFSAAQLSFASSASNKSHLIRYGEQGQDFFNNFFGADKNNPYSNGRSQYSIFVNSLSMIKIDTTL